MEFTGLLGNSSELRGFILASRFSVRVKQVVKGEIDTKGPV